MKHVAMLLAFVCGAVLATAVAAQAASFCEYGGYGYSPGADICQSGTQFRCERGVWHSLGIACPEQRAQLVRTCDYSGGVYSSGAALCVRGSEYLCEDGLWRNMGTACRLAGDNPIVQRVPALPPGSCVDNGRVYENTASLCQSGFRFACRDGVWRNLGPGC